MPLLSAPPDVFALLTRPISEDRVLQQWVLETVVAFDSEDGGAYIVGGLNRDGRLARLDEVAARNGFTIAGVWEQEAGSKEAAREWAEKHIKAVYESPMAVDRHDPRWSS